MREEEGRGSWERPSGPCWLRGAGRGQELGKAVGEVGEGDSRLGPTSTGRGSDHSQGEQGEGRLWSLQAGAQRCHPWISACETQADVLWEEPSADPRVLYKPHGLGICPGSDGKGVPIR